MTSASQDLETLLKTLTITISSSNTNEISQAESYLKSQEGFSIQNIDNLVAILYDANFKKELKQALILYIKNTIIKWMKTFSLESNQLVSIISSLTFPLLNGTPVEDSILNQVNSLLLEIFSSTIIDLNVINDFTENIHSLLSTKNSYYIFSFYQIVISSKNAKEDNIRKLREVMLKDITKEITISSPEILRKILDLLNLTIKKLSMFGLVNQYIDEYINSLMGKICEVLSRHTNQTKIIVNFVGKDSSEEKIKETETLNSITAKSLLIISYFIQFSSKEDISHPELLKYLNQLLQFLISSLYTIASTHLKDINDKRCDYELVIYYTMFLISRCAVRAPFFSQFQENATEFIFKIIFPLLCNSSVQINQDEITPEEYYTRLIDSMYEFKLKTISTVSGYLLASLCDKFPDLPMSILNFIFQLLTFNMNELDERALTKYNLINNETGKFIIRNFSPEVQINSSLLFMCILAKHTLKNEIIKNNLRLFFISNQIRLQDMTSDIIKYKICLMYGLFLDDLFSTESDKGFLEKSFSFLIKLIVNPRTNSGLAYQALNSFEQICQIEEFAPIAGDIVRENLPQFISMIPTTELDIFFDMLCTLILNLQIDDYVMKICEMIVQRFIKDYNDKNDIFVNKELNLLLKVTEKVHFVSPLPEILAPLFTLFKSDAKIRISDEVIGILYASTIGTKAPSELLFTMFPSYDDYLCSQGGFNEKLFKIMNFIIVNDPNGLIYTNENISRIFNNMIDVSINSIDEYNGQPTPIFAILLVIIWLSNNRFKVGDNAIVVKIIGTIIEKINDAILVYKNGDINDINNTYDCYLLWSYLTVIYSGMINYSSATFSVIDNRNFLNELLEYTAVILNTKFFSVEFGKIITLGFSAMLFDDSILSSITTVFGKIYSLMINMLKKTKSEEITQKKENEFTGSNNYLADDSDEEDNPRVQKKESEEDKQMKQFISLANIELLSSIDEYDILNKVHLKLVAIPQFQQEINSIVSSMNPEQRKEYEILLKTRRISIGNKTVPRAIYTLKHKYN